MVVPQIGELVNTLDLRQRVGVIEADFSEEVAHESVGARERFFYASKNERIYQLGAVVRVDF